MAKSDAMVSANETSGWCAHREVPSCIKRHGASMLPSTIEATGGDASLLTSRTFRLFSSQDGLHQTESVCQMLS